MVLNSKLPAFLRAKAAQGFVWGVNDCGLWLGDWLSLATGCGDVWASVRGTYSSEEESRARFGPHAPLRQARDVFERAGLKRTSDALPGDIGVIAVMTTEGRKIVGAIRVHRGWMTLAPAGVSCIPTDQTRVLRAWRVEERDAATDPGPNHDWNAARPVREP